MIKLFILLLMMLVSMGFYLFTERKMMSLIQYRLGPNKVTFLGLFQFLVDMSKLIFKEHFYMFMIKFYYLFFYIVILLFSFMFWFILNFSYIIFFSEYFFILMMILMLFKLLLLMWIMLMKKSIYVQLSFVRSLVQLVSYDIMIILIILLLVLMINYFNMFLIFKFQKYICFFLFNFYLLIIWFISLMMEILRLPFDFYESESELISGFNLELSSLNFIFLFMVEYLDMIYFIILTVLIFFYMNLIYLLYILFLLMMLWIRFFVIRFRYDLMLNLMWSKFFFFFFVILFLFLLLMIIY